MKREGRSAGKRDPVRRMLDRLSRRIAAEVRKVQPSAPRRDPYLQISVLHGRHPHHRASLSSSELRVFSQNGEDGVIAEIFARIGVESRFFVEFGVEDGTECNTRFLADVLGWSGVYFEVDESEVQRLRRRMCSRDDIPVVQEMVTPENANDVFSAASIPHEFDLLSIDIDGQDFWVWHALQSVRPRVVVIEYNSTLPAGERLVEPRGRGPWDETDFFGASLGALEALGEAKGYRLVHTDLTGANAFFVRSDLAEPFGAPVRHGANLFLSDFRHHEDPFGREYVRLDETSFSAQRADDAGELG